MSWISRLFSRPKRKHLTLVKDYEGYDWIGRNWGRHFIWRCAKTGETFSEFDSGNYRNLCVSFRCTSCGGSFRGDEMDQPYVLDAEQRLMDYYRCAAEPGKEDKA